MSPAKHLETVARALAHVSATCVGRAWRGEAVQQLPQGVAKAAGRLGLLLARAGCTGPTVSLYRNNELALHAGQPRLELCHRAQPGSGACVPASFDSPGPALH